MTKPPDSFRQNGSGGFLLFILWDIQAPSSILAHEKIGATRKTNDTD